MSVTASSTSCVLLGGEPDATPITVILPAYAGPASTVSFQ
jgi:hypothetical protein